MRQEWLVDFGDNMSSRFVELAMVESVAHGAKMCQRIVRCKDCKWYVPEFGYSEERGFGQIEYLMEPPACARHEGFEITVDSDGFCAWGERKEDA